MITLYDLVLMQDKLDKHIAKKQKLENYPHAYYDDKKTALLVELSELANEIQFFKYWKVNNEPRYYAICTACNGKGKLRTDDEHNCFVCFGTGEDKYNQPVLEEYVDCIHFLLSLALDIFGNDKDKLREKLENVRPLTSTSLQHHFLNLYGHISFNLYTEFDLVAGYLLGLGEMLGYTMQDIADAYVVKNNENFRRQERGY